MEDNRYCTIQKHEQEKIQFICMHEQCQFTRFLCSLCLFQKIHKHQIQDDQHIITLEILYQRLSAEIISLSKQFKKKQLEYKNVLQQMKIQLEAIQQQIHNIREHLLYKQVLWKLISQKKFSLLNEDIINEIVNGKQFQIDDIIIPVVQNSSYVKYQKPVQTQSLQQQIMSLSDQQYELVEIDKSDSTHQFYTAALSNNGQFIALGGNDQKLKIFYKETQILEFNLSHMITKCKFSHDDQYLYVGQESDLLQINVFENFRQTIQFKLNKQILDIFFLSNQILLVANHKFISTVDFQSQSIKLNIIAHDSAIFSIDIYQNQMISCSSDNKIKLWDQFEGKLLLTVRDVCSENDLKQVKFISKDEFLCLAAGKISKWVIFSTCLKRIKIIPTNFHNYKMQMLGEQHILLFQVNKIQIIKLQGETIKVIDHNINKIGNILYN